MGNERYILRMIFECPYGESHQMAIDVNPSIAREFQHIPLPSPFLNNFVSTAKLVKNRQLRKDVFIDAATRLGQKLAENMEDKEGWHGEDRRSLTQSKGEMK